MSKTLKRPIVKCECCKGSGQEPLPETLWETLQIVAKFGEVTSQVIARASSDEVGATAYTMRLERLRALGFIDRRRKLGKFWVYSR